VLGKSARYRLAKDEVVRIVTGTGGGFGDPGERPVDAVVDDVRDGYVSVEQAELDYGVVLDPATLDVLRLSGRGG